VKEKNRFIPKYSVYKNFSALSLEQLIRKSIPEQYSSNFNVYVRLEPPVQSQFSLYRNVLPVHTSIHTKNDKRAIKSAIARFQTHMIWQSGLRECMRWVSSMELKKKRFFDFVMRLREDALIIRNMLISSKWFRNKIVSLETGSNGGINDHAIIVDRFYADNIFRGLTEGYYLNHVAHGDYWGNPERLFNKLAYFYGVAVMNRPMCTYPIISIYKPFNSSHCAIDNFSNRYVNKENILKSCKNKETLSKWRDFDFHAINHGKFKYYELETMLLKQQRI
jgi:hypothetical protein